MEDLPMGFTVHAESDGVAVYELHRAAGLPSLSSMYYICGDLRNLNAILPLEKLEGSSQ